VVVVAQGRLKVTSFFSAKLSDRLGRTSPKWPIFVSSIGNKTLTQSASQSVTNARVSWTIAASEMLAVHVGRGSYR